MYPLQPGANLAWIAAAVLFSAFYVTGGETENAVLGGSSSLAFLDCEGEPFDPAWAAFRLALPPRLIPDVHLDESLVMEASRLLDSVEGENSNLPLAVAAFGARLRGEPGSAEELGGFCLFGTVAAYATIAFHLSRTEGETGMSASAKSSLARGLMVLAKKHINDFLESSTWPIRSMDLVAEIEHQDYAQVRQLASTLRLPCFLRLGCPEALQRAEAQALLAPELPLPAAWPTRVVAVGLHTTSTMEAVSALRDSITEAWGRGGAAGAPFEIQYAGHPCPSHSGSEHHCAMRCELLGICSPEADAADPLAEFVAGAVDVAKFEERESYSLSEARSALRWATRRLEPLRKAELIVCTFPTVICVLLHELLPETPLLFVAIASPLFAAPGCTKQEDSTVRDCETTEAQEFLLSLRQMLTDPEKPVRGVAGYTVTTALLAYQAGVVLPLAGKAGRYLPHEATWQGAESSEVLVARSRFLETAFGAAFRNMLTEFKQFLESHISFLLQQEAGTYLSYEALSAFRAVVVFPQDLGLHKFTEHYAMGMPIWVPSREWVYRLQMFVPWGMVSYSGSWLHPGPSRDGEMDEVRGAWWEPPAEAVPGEEPPALAFPPFFNSQTAPYQLAKTAYWYEYGEFVAYPGVQEFSSMPELFDGLANADLLHIATAMRRHRADLWRTTRAVYAAAASELASVAARMHKRSE